MATDPRPVAVAIADAHAPLVALIGTRRYPSVLPQRGAYPAEVYELISLVDSEAMGASAGIPVARFQWTAYAEDPDTAAAVNATVRDAFGRTRGTFAGVVVQDCFLETSQDGFEAEVGRDGLYWASTDVRIHYVES